MKKNSSINPSLASFHSPLFLFFIHTFPPVSPKAKYFDEKYRKTHSQNKQGKEKYFICESYPNLYNRFGTLIILAELGA